MFYLVHHGIDGYDAANNDQGEAGCHDNGVFALDSRVVVGECAANHEGHEAYDYDNDADEHREGSIAQSIQ